MKGRSGRPTDYTDELLNKAHEYLAHCPDVVHTVVGLCLYIGIAKSTCYRWIEEGNETFKDIVDEVSELQEQKLVSGGLKNEYNASITKLMLTKHGYTDKVETDITTKGQSVNTWVVNPVTTNKNG